MSIRLEAVRDKPISFWMLDSNQDISGYGIVPTLPASPVKHAALASGASYAPTLSNTARATFPFAFFTRTQESRSFTIEAVIRPITFPAVQQILGHLDAYDGLVFDGTTLSFVTKYLTTGEARASYLLDPIRSVHVVAVHTVAKNSLYIDSVLVDEVDITEEQRQDQFVVDSSTLVAGQSSGSGSFAINALALYNYPLSPESVARHAFAAKDVPDVDAVAESFNGERVGSGIRQGSVYLEEVYEHAEDWEAGTFLGVVPFGDELVFDVVENVNGQWTTSFALDFGGLTSINGVQIAWEGEGVSVQTSLTGNSWTTVTNGRFASGISAGYNPTNKDLFVRVIFNGATGAYLSRLSVTGYADSDAQLSGRTINRLGTIYDRADAPVIDYQNGWGIELAGGALTISPPDDAGATAGPGTIEIWARNINATPGVLLDAQDATHTGYAYMGATTSNQYTANGTLYINGAVVAQPFTWRVNHFTLIHVVVANTAPTTIHLGETYQGTQRGRYEIGSVVFYEDQLSANTISEIYKTYVGRPALRQSDNSVIRVTQPLTGALIYAADWSIQSAG